MIEAADIAIVSFDRFLNGGDAEKRVVAKQLYDAFSTVGWVYLKDHGIPQERVDEIFGLVSFLSPLAAAVATDISQAKSFFDLPLQKKCTWRLKDAELTQGYTGDGDEANGGVDHKGKPSLPWHVLHH
jgi:isopenicillin N synthase-like dioxygenase